MVLNDILTRAVEQSASDILLIAGLPVAYKINGVILRGTQSGQAARDRGR